MPRLRLKAYPEAEKVLEGIATIRAEVDTTFQYKPEYYKAMTIRIIDYLEKQRPDIFNKKLKE